MIQARLSRNKFDNEFFLDGKKLEGVIDAKLEYEGKVQVLVLKIRDFKILPESACPERNRFERIMQAFGDPQAVARLEPACSLIKLNPRACDGCKDRPI